jgi:hypothetical protein
VCLSPQERSYSVFWHTKKLKTVKVVPSPSTPTARLVDSVADVFVAPPVDASTKASQPVDAISSVKPGVEHCPVPAPSAQAHAITGKQISTTSLPPTQETSGNPHDQVASSENGTKRQKRLPPNRSGALPQEKVYRVLPPAPPQHTAASTSVSKSSKAATRKTQQPAQREESEDSDVEFVQTVSAPEQRTTSCGSCSRRRLLVREERKKSKAAEAAVNKQAAESKRAIK